jgi:hypothetical protein
MLLKFDHRYVGPASTYDADFLGTDGKIVRRPRANGAP